MQADEELLYISRNRIISTLGKISSFARNIVDEDPSISIEAMSVRLETLNEMWEEYRAHHDQIARYSQNESFAAMAEQYHKAKATLLHFITNNNNKYNK